MPSRRSVRGDEAALYAFLPLRFSPSPVYAFCLHGFRAPAAARYSARYAREKPSLSERRGVLRACHARRFERFVRAARQRRVSHNGWLWRRVPRLIPTLMPAARYRPFRRAEMRS